MGPIISAIIYCTMAVVGFVLIFFGTINCLTADGDWMDRRVQSSSLAIIAGVLMWIFLKI